VTAPPASTKAAARRLTTTAVHLRAAHLLTNTGADPDLATDRGAMVRPLAGLQDRVVTTSTSSTRPTPTHLSTAAAVAVGVVVPAGVVAVAVVLLLVTVLAVTMAQDVGRRWTGRVGVVGRRWTVRVAEVHQWMVLEDTDHVTISGVRNRMDRAVEGRRWTDQELATTTAVGQDRG